MANEDGFVPANALKRLSLRIGTGANVHKKILFFVFFILYLYLILTTQCLKPSRGQNIQYFVASTCTRDQSELFHAKGRVGLPKGKIFRKTSKGGEGGTFSIQKLMLQTLDLYIGFFSDIF